MKKISVIIPMYNAERFIGQCLLSVMNQTYPHLEIIVIDDDSSDGGWKICSELMEKDSRICLVRQEHRGISRTRNHGLELSTGEYIFFLDSDDAIHPLLLEELLNQVEKQHADMAFCNFIRVESREMDDVFGKAFIKDSRPQWQTAEGEEAEAWFHGKYIRELSRISGMISKESIGNLRFDESLVNGEDTMFLYQLFCKQLRVVYSPCRWYYYRMHAESVMHTVKTIIRDGYFDSCIRIRDSESRRGHDAFALNREAALTIQIRDKYAICRKIKDRESGSRLRSAAAREKRNRLYQSLPVGTRLLFVSCFTCYPVYVLLNGLAVMSWEWKERNKNEGK